MQKIIYMGWLQVCEGISMAQGPCNGVTLSIWYPYKACFHRIARAGLVSPCWLMVLTIQKNDISGVASGMWCDCHGSSPMQLYCIINLVPINFLLYHWISRVGLKWPSIPCISMLIYGSINHGRIWFIWGGFRCVVWLPWLKPNTMVLYLPSDILNKYDKDRTHMTTNNMYSHADWCTEHGRTHPSCGESRCVVSLSWFKPNAMVSHHPYGTYTK